MKKKYNGVCVKVYFNPKTFAEVAYQAEKAGKRRVGLKLFTSKPHGFANEKVANTDGIASYLKYCSEQWDIIERTRTAKLATLLKQREELEKEIKTLEIKS